MSAADASTLRRLLSPIQADLALVEEEIRRMLETHARPLEALLQHVSQFSGKRLRPALAMVAARLFGPVNSEHVTAAAIVELIHTATLVHDDILDESTMRRRVETINHRVGSETAVLLGDYIFATCFKEAASLEDRFVSRYLSEVVAVVCRGEILQVHHRNDFDLDEKTYFTIIEEKTAALYAAALRCGARLSAAGEAAEHALYTFGLKIGCAFQIVDDILDLTGEEEAVGKSLGTDLEKAKMTLPLLRLRDAAGDGDREHLRAVIHGGDARARREVRPLLEKYGAIEAARETALALVEEAQALLRELPDRPERAILEHAAGYVLARDR